MCATNQPVLVSFSGGTPNDTSKVISKLVRLADGSLQTVLLRFSQAPLQCTGTTSSAQLSCYFPPAEYAAAKLIALDPTKSLRVHGTGHPAVTQAAWSAV